MRRNVLLCVMIGSAAGLASVAGAQDIHRTTDVRVAPEIIDLRAIQDGIDLESNGYEIVSGLSDRSVRERARHGAGNDAPEYIAVRAFDGVFLIDPFVRMNELIGRPIDEHGETLSTMRQVFGKFSLNTSRELFGWERVERTAELFEILEVARQDWLRANGYASVRTFRAPGAGEDDGSASAEPTPRMRIERPADAPKTRSRESVRGDAPSASDRAMARAMLDGEARISRPTDVLGGDAVVSRPDGAAQDEEVSSR